VGQSPTWGRPALQVRVGRQFRGLLVLLSRVKIHER